MNGTFASEVEGGF